MKKLSCAAARQIDLVDYLDFLGHHPKKIRNQDYWYLSPFRQERTASFKVDRKRNIWYDQGRGQGGDIIDFGVLYYNCSVGDLLGRLSDSKAKEWLSFHPHAFSVPLPTNAAGEKEDDTRSKITVTDIHPLSSPALLNYLESRSIPLQIAARHCQEADFILYDKKQTAISFQNDSGGFELRNQYFKGSSSPKASTFIGNNSTQVLVFEGFFDFLSYQTLYLSKDVPATNILVLNSLAFFERQQIKMEEHEQIHLFLDKDPAGMKCTEQALKSGSRYIDESHLYSNFKDLNEWVMQASRSRLLYEKMKRGPVNNQIKINRHGRI